MKITNGKSVLDVSQAVYKAHFESLPQWTPVEGQYVKEKSFNDMFHATPPYEAERDIEEIPVSEMTAEQLKEYAHKHGIDISGLRSKADVRERINEYLSMR